MSSQPELAGWLAEYERINGAPATTLRMSPKLYATLDPAAIPAHLTIEDRNGNVLRAGQGSA